MIQCQSCGMPLTHDPLGGGNEADGTRSTTYCSYCYQDGQFVGDFTDAKQMQDFCFEKLREQGTLRPIAWLMTRQIPKLSRWHDAR